MGLIMQKPKGRHQKLPSDEAHLVKLRVVIAQKTNLFSPKAVAEGFGIHVNTARRYTIEKEREYSRELSKKKHRDYKVAMKTCEDCGQSALIHKKCADCHKLIHTEVYNCRCGVPHSLSYDDKLCTSCQEYREHGILYKPLPSDLLVFE